MFSIFQLRCQRVDDLSAISQELVFLESNMVKEQKRLQEIIKGKDDALKRQEEELEKLRKQNKKLQMLAKAKMMLLGEQDDRDMDTPSSEDSSPKASFSKVPKVEIKPRALASKITEKAMTTGSGGGVKTSAPVASLIEGETEQIRQDMRKMMLQPKEGTPPVPPPKHKASDPPPAVLPRPARAAPIGACSPSSSSESGSVTKPPVPSRAAVNKKLQGKPPPQLPPTSSSSVPPPLPQRSPATRGSAKSTKEERVDSGRESDDFGGAERSNDSSFEDSRMKKTFNEFLQDNMTSYAATTSTARSSSSVQSLTGDEGFSSSHEDHLNPAPPPPPPRTTSATGDDSQRVRQLTNHHRAVQKPRDIKYRSKLKSNSTSSLGVLEEHQVAATEDGSGAAVTTVTYWTEPYL